MSEKSQHRAQKEPPQVVAGLFAGIGGLEVGLSAAGHHTTVLCDSDPAAARVLQVRFPGVDHVQDVRDIDRLPRQVTLLTAGFPCQDLSSSGIKNGIEGTQSSLVNEVFRILETKPVNWVLIENVRFMLHLNGGQAMEHIARRFEELGYDWAYRVLNSQAFGVPQRRHRVFFLAARKGDPRSVLLSDNIEPREDPITSLNVPVGFYWTEGTYATGLARNAIPPLKGGSTIGIPSPPAVLMPDGFVGTPSLTDAERLQGFKRGWTEPADAAKRSARWRLLGNAVTVPVAAWIGKKLRDPVMYDASQDTPMATKWPNAGWCVGGERFVSQAGDWPCTGKTRGLSEFLSSPLTPLSRKAVAGFLRRAQAGRLSFPRGFLRRVERYEKDAR